MAGVGPLDLYGLFEEVLDASVEALDMIPTFSPGLGGAPESAFIEEGTPAFDCCPQLVVYNVPIREAPTTPLELGAGTRHKQDFRVNLVGINVLITRCMDWGQNELPTPAIKQAVAEQTQADAWALWNYLWNMARAGDLFTICSQVYFDSLDPLTPAGNCYGWILRLRAGLQGFEGTPTP